MMNKGNSQAPRKPDIDVRAYAEGVLSGDRAMLARAITLIESQAPHHRQAAQDLLARLLLHRRQSIRIGITGAPGAGKSTFIDALGFYLSEENYQVAVLAIDPSSSISGGSILGDKTRMERLARSQKAFIRPSPTGGALGGVASKTREAIFICEAAGCDVILIETVGSGQSEIAARSMVDFFLLLLIAGAGDDLQGIKKGVLELADALLIHKADGDNKIAAQAACAQFNRVLRFLAPATRGWNTRAHTASGLTGEGIENIWGVIQAFEANTKQSGIFEQRRQSQMRDWLHHLVEAQLQAFFFQHPAVQSALPELEATVMRGEVPAAAAARQLLGLMLPLED